MFGRSKQKSTVETVVAYAPEAMFGVDSNGRISCWNDKMRELTGIRAAQMLGKGSGAVFVSAGASNPVEETLSRKIARETKAALAGSRIEVSVGTAPISGKRGIEGTVVTVRRRTTDATERCARDLADIPTPVMRIDREFTIEYMNRAGAALLGLTPESCVGRKCYTLFKTDHCRTPECRCDQAMRNDTIAAGETVADSGGKNLPIHYTGTPVKDSDGKIIGALEYVIDITETKQALHDAQEKEAYLNAVPTPVMVIDRQFNVVYLNPKGASLLGSTPEALRGRKCYDLFKTPHCNTSECRCNQAMTKGVSAAGETVADPGGLNMPIRYTAAPLKNEQGEIVGALEYVTDITETKALITDAETKVNYLNNIPTPVMVINRNFDVQFMNPAAAGAVGSTPEAVKGRKCYDLFKTPHCRTPDCRCGQAMDRNGVFTGETVADPNGLNLPIEYTGAPLKNADGTVVGALEYVVDITDRKAVLKDIIHVAEEMANNNLTVSADGNYAGDFLAIAENLNRGVKAQHDAMLQVAEAVEQISSAAGQIASSSQQVAEGASEQASALEESAGSLEQMAGMLKQNAENTNQAKSLSEETRGSSNLGAEAMGGMVKSMGEIKSAAERTGAIIKDINEIAFQTNLLALNAAVEAARAGDAGRGFAVVAEEVRNLAGRAKEAAKKTEELIKESVSLTKKGEAVSGDVSTRLDQITAAAAKVNQIISEIATAGQEQAKGIEQINRAVAEMDKVVQSSAANAEESSSAAEELAGQSEELSTLVGSFKLNRSRIDRTQRSSAASAPKPARRKPTPQKNSDQWNRRARSMLEQMDAFDDDANFAEF